MWIYSINIRMNTNDSLVEIAKKKINAQTLA